MYPSQIFPKANPHQTIQKHQEQENFQNYCVPRVTEPNISHAECVSQRVQNPAANCINSRDPRLVKKSYSFNNFPVNLPVNCISPSNDLSVVNQYLSNIQNSHPPLPGEPHQKCLENSDGSNSSYLIQASQKYYQEIYQNYSPSWFFPNCTFQNRPETSSVSSDKEAPNQSNPKSPYFISFSTSQNRSYIPITSQIPCRSDVNFCPEGTWDNFNSYQNKVHQTASYATARHDNEKFFNCAPNGGSIVCDKIGNEDQITACNVTKCNLSVHKTGNNVAPSSGIQDSSSLTSHPRAARDLFCNKNKKSDDSRSQNKSSHSRRNRRSRSGSHYERYHSRSRSHSSNRHSKGRSRSRSGSKSRSKYRSASGPKSRSKYRSGSGSKSRSKYRSRSGSKSSSRFRYRSRSGSKSRSRYRSRSGSKSSSRYRYRSRSRSKPRSTNRYRSRSGSKSSSRYRYRSRSRSKPRSTNRYRSRSGSKSRSRSKPRSTNRYRSRSGSKSRSRYRSTSRSRYKSRSHSRAIFRSRSRSKSASKSKHYDSVPSMCHTYNRRDSKGNHRSTPEKSENLRRLIEKWRMNNCDTQDEMQKRLQEISEMNPDEILEEENKVWIRSAPADCYYERDPTDLKRMRATERLEKLCEKFRCELLYRGKCARQAQNLKCPSPPKPKQKLCKHKSQICSCSSESGSETESDDMNDIIEELQRKQKHPYRLHPELWYNAPGEMNDGPLCRCSAKARRSGIRHGFYAGENQRAYCDPKSNNAGHLYHYRITISPPTNFLTRTPTIINHDDHEFIFEGFSLISHYPIEKLPTCKVIRFNIEYIILYVEEKLPDNFCIQEVDLFYNYLFKEILELVDFDMVNIEFPDSCPQFHFMPRFVRELPENGRELLPMCEVLKYLLQNNKKLIEDDALEDIHKMSNTRWQRFADSVKGMVVTNPGMKPCSLRVDQLDRDTDEYRKRKSKSSASDDLRKSPSSERSSREKEFKQTSIEDSDNSKLQGISKLDNKSNPMDSNKFYPEIVHFGIRPPQLSYAGNPEYQKAWRMYVKFRHLLANMPKPTPEDKQKLAAKENCLHTMRAHNKMKRDVTVTVSSEGFYLTGLMCDVVQHAMLIPVLVCHLRFHRSLAVLEDRIGYKFQNRFLLQLALTHPSYRENFGTNPDHARNSLTNCGIRQPKYGDRRIHYMNTRKRGINTLISIMSRFGKKNETQSNIYHNERLEFLGDAVVEFITSIHLFHIFRDLEEGGLATYRAALVQNQHLAVLAKKLNLDEYMLYAHGSDLCHDLELKHAMANCFEALMGALFLDGGIEAADHVFGHTLYGDDPDCLDVWCNYPPHPLQEQEPLGDRKWILQFPLLQKLTEFEEDTGIQFKHIRLLARAFTDRSVGYTNLTMGSNQRLEFLGDSVLQLIASEYLYKYFPEHHEGHLSLLRSSLVNNKTQSVVCDDLGMTKYAVYANPKVELKIKDRADLLEAFLGALYVDNGLEVCRVFCDVCFFPRLQIFIMNQDWNDPKSKLQQCCLTLRTMDNVEPDIPVYKVVECKGPTNTRVYTVAVYFRNKRLAEATGHSIQQAEMNAAQKAMEISGPLFPQLDHQKRVIAKSLKTQKWPNRNSWSLDSANSSPRDEGSRTKRSLDED